MAKSNGLGSSLFVDGYDLSNDVQTAQFSSPAGVLDVSGMNVTGTERIYGRHDGRIAATTFFNDAAAHEHLILRGKSAGADRQAMFFMGGAIGNAACALVAKQINYDPSFAQDGGLTSQVECLGNLYGLDWGKQLTVGKRTDSSATNGASLNNGAASATGGVAYCQVFSIAGTSVTVKVQESSNDGAGDAFADILTFTAVTAGNVGFERKALAALTTAMEQYTRAVTTGTFSSAVFAVMLSREPYAL